MSILVSSIVKQEHKYSYYSVTVTFTIRGLILAFKVEYDDDDDDGAYITNNHQLSGACYELIILQQSI